MAINLKPLCPYLACSDYCKTLTELSKSRQGDRCIPESSSVANFVALNLDEIKADCCRKHGYPLGGLSADAFLSQGDDVYLIEFKTSNIGDGEWFRKIYDSVILLVELGVLTFDDCRRRLNFILVQRNAESRTGGNYASDPDRDARFLEGLILKKVERLSPERFEEYVNNKGWRHAASISTCVAVTLYRQDNQEDPPRNSVYPADWSEARELPLPLAEDSDITDFLCARANLFFNKVLGREIRWNSNEGLLRKNGKLLISMECNNPLDTNVLWFVTSWLKIFDEE